jgi:hypothetical protein
MLEVHVGQVLGSHWLQLLIKSLYHWCWTFGLYGRGGNRKKCNLYSYAIDLISLLLKSFDNSGFFICNKWIWRAAREAKSHRLHFENVNSKLEYAYIDIWGSGGIAPCILHFGTRWRGVVSFTSRWFYSQGTRPRYPLYRRLGGLQSLSGRGKVKGTFHEGVLEEWRYRSTYS